jgi:hypothetical protein
MKVQDYIDHIARGEIPPEPPDGLTEDGFSYDSYTRTMGEFDSHIDYIRKRSELLEKHKIYFTLDQIWTRELAEWIGKRVVLEIMGGRGFLGKALSQFGVGIFVTDDHSWKLPNVASCVHPVIRVDAINAVKIYGNHSDILLVCWPPYGEETIVEAIQLWGSEKPIVYIGEGSGGCTAPEEFFQHFRTLDDHPKFSYRCWDAIHDSIMIGFYSEEELFEGEDC